VRQVGFFQEFVDLNLT